MATAATFVFNVAHRVVVCRSCGSCIGPGQSSLERHLRRKPHNLVGRAMKSTVAYLLTLDLRPLAELLAHEPEDGGAPVEHLKTHRGYRCLFCGNNADSDDDNNSGGDDRDRNKSFLERTGGRPFSTIHQPLMARHVSDKHGKKASQHVVSKPLGQECRLQSYFAHMAASTTSSLCKGKRQEV